MPISSDEFRVALSKFASGVTIVTTKDSEGNLYGMTVSAFCSVSLDPPLVLICVEKTAASHAALGESGVFAVNVLAEDQAHHSNHFALPLEDKFKIIKYFEGSNGIPLIENALVNLECRVVNSHDSGDHTIFIGEVERSNLNDAENPLIYFEGRYRAIGETLL
ncbi:MAG: flavin reductase family protein [Pyrinomonadaceae bacterium]|nr:flavin reductase family protein [Pyrinomonadaceae bacterium]